jgi:hypothetical protein
MTSAVEKALGSGESFAAMAAAFERAQKRRPDEVVLSHYLIAGRLARVRVVGQALAHHVESALAHLRLPSDPGTPPQLRIDLWDEAAAAVGCIGCEPGRTKETAEASADGRFIVYDLLRTKTALDRSTARIVGWAGNAAELTNCERGRPFQAPLLLWLMDQDVHSWHAGCVARDDRALLFAGPSGSGKTTVSLVCAAAGFDFLSDDCVGIEAKDGVYMSHSLYGSASVEANHLQRFPSLARRGVPAPAIGEQKSLVVLRDALEGAASRSAVVRGVVLPRVRHAARTTFRPALKPEAVMRVAPSTLFLLPRARGRNLAFERVVQLISSLPTFWLDLGDDMTEIAPCVAEILDRVGD